VVLDDTETRETIVRSIISSPYVPSVWSIDHEPYDVMCEYPEKDEWDLDDVVRHEMARCGGNNVRGGNYSDDTFSDADMVCIERHISSIRKNCAVKIQTIWRGFGVMSK
jgi:hypothetical protein